jgi:F-type H+-transporting ATPase subunit epsilon
MPIKLEIVTPEARIFPDRDADGRPETGDVDSVVLPGMEGEMGVLPQHAPLVSTLKPGELKYTVGGKTVELAVGEGLVEVTQTNVRVLTDMAIGAEDIDEKAVEEALARAKQSLETLKPGEHQEEVAAVMAIIQRSTAQLHLKRKRRTV